jgi:hypothetical protein
MDNPEKERSVSEAERLRAKARHYQQLADEIGDKRAREVLAAFAREYNERADAARLANRTP